MLSEQKKYFLMRADQPGHRSLIENRYRAKTRPDEHFRELCRSVFRLHAADIPMLEEPEWPEAHEFDHKHLPQGLRAWLSYRFHKHHYALPESLTVGFAPDGDVVSTEHDFLSRLRSKIRPGHPNKITYLIGDIGSGKSTLASNIIMARGPNCPHAKSVVPIRIDIDRKFDHKIPPPGRGKASFLSLVYHGVLNGYRNLNLVNDSEYRAVISDTTFEDTANTTTVAQALRRLFEAYARATGMTPLLIIDNLDFLYHTYDRGLFINEATNGIAAAPEQSHLLAERTRAHTITQYIISAFQGGEDDLTAVGVNMLLTLRQDSLEYFAAGRKDLSGPDPRHDTYRLHKPKVPNVMEALCSLLQDAISRWPKETLRDVYLEAMESLAPVAEQHPGARGIQRRLNADLLSLSRQWLRQVVDHFGRYVWLPIALDEAGEKVEVTDRFQEQYTPGIVSFLQNGNRLFSQFAAEFPNIYLVRGDKVEERNPAYLNLYKEHKHTYWLKRLILEYVAQMELAGHAVHPAMVYETLVDRGDGHGYEDSIVRLCLGSLSQVESSHVLGFRLLPGCPPTEPGALYVTSRGWRMMGYIENGQGRIKAQDRFMDTFTYLQIIFDDYILPFPNCLSSVYKYQDGLDYGYLAASPDDYTTMVYKMVRYKIKQVFCFLKILEVTLELEKEHFSSAFGRLERVITIPNVEGIEQSVRESLNPVIRHLQRHDPSIAIDASIVDPSEYLEALREEMKEAYGCERTARV